MNKKYLKVSLLSKIMSIIFLSHQLTLYNNDISQKKDNREHSIINNFISSNFQFGTTKADSSSPPFYVSPYYYVYPDHHDDNYVQFQLYQFISGCNGADLVKNGQDCNLFQLTITSQTIQVSRPYPNKLCNISLTCNNPNSNTQYFTISSYTFLCSSKNSSQIVYYTPQTIQNKQFMQYQTVSIEYQISDIWSLNTLFLSSISYGCTLLRLVDTKRIPLTTSSSSFTFKFDTSIISSPKDYYIYCYLYSTGCEYMFSNSFSIEVIAGCTASIQQINSQNLLVSNQLPQIIILSGYASTSQSDCSLSYKLFFSNQTQYTATSPLQLDILTGVLTLTSQQLFQYNLYIRATIIYQSSNLTSTLSSQFTIAQSCGSYCTPFFTKTISPLYSLPVLSQGGQIVLSDYASTSNPSNCIITYSMQVQPQNLTYNDKSDNLQISSTTGEIQTNNNIFTSEQLKITITSTYQQIPCSGTVQSSQFIVIQYKVSCNNMSFNIIAPTIFKQKTLFNWVMGSFTNLVFDNFTTTTQHCPIVLHSLTQSEKSGNAFKIIEGSSQFKLVNNAINFAPQLYTLQIQAFVQGGKFLRQTIQIQTQFNCSNDVIYIKQASPSDIDKSNKYYQSVNNFPIYVLEQQVGQSINVNIKLRFKNLYSQGCPLVNYKILKVLSQETLIPSTVFDQYFNISSNGQFYIHPQNVNPFSHLQVYIQAFNTEIWGGDNHYVIDATVKPKAQLQNSMYISPQFASILNNITIDLSHQSQGILKIFLPIINKPNAYLYIKDQKMYPFMRVNQQNQKAQLLINISQIIQYGQYNIELVLDDNIGSNVSYPLSIFVVNQTKEILTAKIISIDQYGLIKIQFSDQIRLNESLSWINYNRTSVQYFNNSWINSSNTHLSILPALQRQNDDFFISDSLQFIWKTTQILNQNIEIQLNFTHPQEISPLSQQDKLQIQFNGSQFLFVSEESGLALDQKYWQLEYPIKKQLSNDKNTQSLMIVSQSAQNMIILMFVFGIFMKIMNIGENTFMMLMIRSLQIIFHLPIFNIVFPQIIITFISISIQITQFDILQNFPFWNLMPFLQFDNNSQPLVSQQLQNIGYQNRNAFQGLATLTIVIYLYLLRVMAFIFVFIFIFFTKNEQKKQKAFKVYFYLGNNLFFNIILELSLEAYFEFFINGVMNFQTAEWGLNGENIGIMLAFSCLFLVMFILPVLCLYVITRSIEYLEKGVIKYICGAIYQNTKYNSKLRVAYTFVFVARRFVFLSIGLFWKNGKLGSVQIIFIYLMNLFVMIYAPYVRAQKSKMQNCIEIINEFFIQQTTQLSILFTDFVPSQTTQSTFAWYFIYVIIFMIFINLTQVFQEIFKSIKLIALKMFNLFNHYKQIYYQKISQNKKLNVASQHNQINIVIKQSIKNQKIEVDKYTEQNKKKVMYYENLIQQINNVYIYQFGNQNRNQESYQQEEYKKEWISKINNTQINNNIQTNKGYIIKSYHDINQFIYKNEKKTALNEFRRARFNSYILYDSKDKSASQLLKILEEYNYLFQSCASNDNKVDEIIKDACQFMLNDRESLKEQEYKLIQFQTFVLNLLMFESSIENPYKQFLKFQKTVEALLEQLKSLKDQ